ncbi:energy transducer TonB [Candidatus Poribacteria bacterium]|jgi:TonB family protein|nr:energy transducer TonB [Candidatus Poribacteria bacterium]MBT5712931.1 energy transducer TonB [Candidatus Poribacteria bacterium]MBT7096614.1 energy transducer TonB [Candidatus Poribacteria bacterium]MBT7805076.1 energy transducer TonB [Candidatus Poribacteria bacterium]
MIRAAVEHGIPLVPAPEVVGMRRRRPTSSALLISLIVHGALAVALSVIVVTQREEIQSAFGAELLAPRAEIKARPIRRRPAPQPIRLTEELNVRAADIWRRPGAAIATAPVATAAIVPNGPGSALVGRAAELPGETMTIPIRQERPTQDVVARVAMGEGRRVDPGRLAPDEALPGLSSFLLGDTPGQEPVVPTPEYWREIQRRIKEKQRYPRFAQESGVQGSTTLRFILRRDGSAEDITVAESSGHRRLDDAAKRSVADASPFPAFPPGQRGDSMPLVVSIIFELE